MGTHKLLLPWHDQESVVQHLISTWNEAGSSQTIVVVRKNDALLNKELDRLKFPLENRLINPNPEAGMISSILAAVSWDKWLPDITHYAIALGDQPQISLTLIRELLAKAKEKPEAIWQPRVEGSSAHPIILPRSQFESIPRAKVKSLKEFLETAQHRSFLPSTNTLLKLDMDYPEDYKRLLTM